MAKCPSCGAENPGYALYCGKCGQVVPRRVDSEPGETGEVPSQGSKDGGIVCTGCWRTVYPTFRHCPYCGKRMGFPSDGASEASPDLESSYAMQSDVGPEPGLVIGGILAIIAGVLALAQGLLYGAVYSLVPEGFLCMCSGLGVLFGLISIIGGIMAIQRKAFLIAFMGAILGMLGVGFLVGFVLGLFAVILIALSKEYFES
jgi:hypothetical protein